MTTTDLTWLAKSACTEDDTYLFFPETAREHEYFVPQAKALCSWCLVKDECLAWALETRAPYGIQGGLPVHEREALITGLATVCHNGHTIADAGKDTRGRCVQCTRDRNKARRDARKEEAAA